MNELLNFLKNRRSIRAFKDKKIPDKYLEKIIDAARFAPTARNLQPWEFVLVTDKSALRRLAEIAENGRFLSQAAACVAVFSLDTKYFLEDGCAATCNILLAAAALKIGSCWIAGDKKDYAKAVNDLLNAPSGMKLVSLVALGYPLEKKAFHQAPKKELKSILHREKF